MKVLNVCFDDYANFSYDNAKALQLAGVDAHSVKLEKHVFNYAGQSELANEALIRRAIREVDLVQIMHSDRMFIEMCVDAKKKFVVYHTGSRYRAEPERFNGFFNPYAEACFTDQCEFMSLGAKNVRYVAGAIDTDRILRAGAGEGVIKFAHYPSKAETKGTREIVRMMGNVMPKYKRLAEFQYSTELVSHDLQLKRMTECDVYIELFKPVLHGKPYGCFGVTAFEAAAMGKLVITNNINQAAYSKEYGYCGFEIVNTPETFESVVDELCRASRTNIEKIKEDARRWIVTKHSYGSTGYKLKSMLEEIL